MSTKEDRESIEWRQGTLDLLILRTLWLGPAHGHAMAQAIEFNSDDLLTREGPSKWDKLEGRSRGFFGRRGKAAGGIAAAK